MLNSIDIVAYKCLEEAHLELRPLTLLAGTNSSGKSTVLQSILLAYSVFDQPNYLYLREVVKPYAQVQEVLCHRSESDTVVIRLHGNSGTSEARLTRSGITIGDGDAPEHEWERSLFYLSANRTGPEEISQVSKEVRIGPVGEYAFGTLDQLKDKPVHSAIVSSNAVSYTLKANIAYWLHYITDAGVEPATEQITATSIKTTYTVEGIEGVSPFNVGVGNSYLLKFLIMALTANPGDLLLVENPEIHLHPRAQSRLGSFLAFLAQRGVQLIVETHCEHLINRVRYEVYRKELESRSVVLHYKGDAVSPFQTIAISETGHFTNPEGEHVPFPGGFFDSTLAELLEIG
jgi:predicted ATPase